MEVSEKRRGIKLYERSPAITPYDTWWVGGANEIYS